MQAVSKTGGHLGSSLGVIELTVALHYVFEAPEDKITWDVSHQASENIGHISENTSGSKEMPHKMLETPSFPQVLRHPRDQTTRRSSTSCKADRHP